MSMDGVIIWEALTLVHIMDVKLERKWQQPYSHVDGYLKACLSVTIIKDNRGLLLISCINTMK